MNKAILFSSDESQMIGESTSVCIKIQISIKELIYRRGNTDILTNNYLVLVTSVNKLCSGESHL